MRFKTELQASLAFDTHLLAMLAHIDIGEEGLRTLHASRLRLCTIQSLSPEGGALHVKEYKSVTG